MSYESTSVQVEAAKKKAELKSLKDLKKQLQIKLRGSGVAMVRFKHGEV